MIFKKPAQIILGPPPWSKDSLERKYFADFLGVTEAIKEHPGYQAHKDLSVLKMSSDLFSECCNDLFVSINNFQVESDKDGFWQRNSKHLREKLELSVRRGIFSASSSSMALVDTSRKINKRYKVLEYQDKVKKLFAEDSVHQFVQELRNFGSHGNVIDPKWEGTFKFGEENQGKSIRFLLFNQDLFNGYPWNSIALKYIKSHEEGIDIEILFRDYNAQVSAFSDWCATEIKKASGQDLLEYRQYEQMLKGFCSKAHWNSLISQFVIPNKLDPFQYLDRYLTDVELSQVNLFPRGSKEQIDKIIEFLDEYKVCDEELRQKVYSIFQVNN